MVPFKNFVLLLLLSLASGIPTFCQGIHFSASSFHGLQEQALRQHKPLFVYLYDKDCKSCAFNTNKLFKDPATSDLVNRNFLSVSVDENSTEGAMIKRIYSLKGFGLYYFGIHGTLLSSLNYITSQSAPNLEAARFAIDHRNDSLIWSLNESFRNGNRSLSFLKELLQVRSLYPSDNRKILEFYVSQLPQDSLKSAEVLHFLLELAPLINSQAFKAIFNDRASIQIAFGSMNKQQITEINNRIIDKSFSLAIRERDSSYARSVAWFTRSTWGLDAIRGQKEYMYKMVCFYRITKDTARHFPLVTGYLNKYFMRVNADSLYKASKSSIEKEIRLSAVTDAVKLPNGIMITHRAYTVPDSVFVSAIF